MSLALTAAGVLLRREAAMWRRWVIGRTLACGKHHCFPDHEGRVVCI